MISARTMIGGVPMARKAKKKLHRMPPLSFVDKLIYWLIMALLIATYFALPMGVFLLRDRIAYQDTTVVAKYDHGSLLWLLVPWMTYFLMTFLLWIQPYQDRKPIFGLRNFKYGPPAFPKVYPLFMKNKPAVYISERKKNEKRGIALLLVVILLVSFIPLPWSLYGRTCLHSDGSMVRYNIFNQVTKEFSAGDVESVEVKAYHAKQGKHSRVWTVQIKFTTEHGRSFSYQMRDFRGNNSETLSSMLQVKGRYHPSVITYVGTEHLGSVIADHKLSPQAQTMLYELFNLSNLNA